MFKNKEIRDNVLLITMALITIAFLVYVFFPSGEKEPSAQGKQDSKPPIKSTTQKKPLRILPIPEQGVDKKVLEELHRKIEQELVDIYLAILASASPFEDYQVDGLQKVLQESENEILKKYAKFSFFDLQEILNIEFPPAYHQALKFNIFLAMFLIKIHEEGAVPRLQELTKREFEKEVNFKIYDLINQEIERDYQAIPLIFYFRLLLDRLNIYPLEDSVGFFRQKTENIMDLSFSKHLIKIKELLSFSLDTDRYRIEWVEHDGIGADDREVYTGLSLKTHHFFKQGYLIFPAPGKRNNTWIKELCAADAGDIELRELKIINENPPQNLKIKKLLYTPLNSQFIVILDEYKGMTEAPFINRLVLNKLRDFHKNFIVLDFSDDMVKEESFQDELERFGNYLKKNLRSLSGD